jgi:RsiW-degrading membrane proteinase PrsW (M82 family)
VPTARPGNHRVVATRRDRRWFFGAVLAWLAVAIVVREFLEASFDPLRLLLRLALAVVLAWFLARLLTRDGR